MPKIVDRDSVRNDILMAFQRCIESKPIDLVSLRDIAAEAGMSHPSLLNYFENKDALVLAYVRYTKDFMSQHCRQWFLEHSRVDYDSSLSYMNAFMAYVANGKEGELRPNATTQTYVLAHYSEQIAIMIQDEFREWRALMEKCLVSVYGDSVGRKEAEAMMILISGTFICNYNHALTGEINSELLTTLSHLVQS